MEKNFKHWHADIAVSDTPVEAGMMFVCKNNSTEDISSPNFLGKATLEKLKGQPLKRRLMCFAVDPSLPGNGNEVIYRDGQVVGYVARAGFGYTVNKTLMFGYVALRSDGEKPSDVIKKSSFEIDVMGQLVPAEPHLTAILPG